MEERQLVRILWSWKNRKKLSVFNVYYLKKDGKFAYIPCSWQKCYDEDAVLDEMRYVAKAHDFEKWLKPNDDILKEHLKNNTI